MSSNYAELGTKPARESKHLVSNQAIENLEDPVRRLEILLEDSGLLLPARDCERNCFDVHLALAYFWPLDWPEHENIADLYWEDTEHV